MSDQKNWDAAVISTWRRAGSVQDAVLLFRDLSGKQLTDCDPPLKRIPKMGYPWKIGIRVFVAKIKNYKNLSLTNFYFIFQVCITGCVIDAARVAGSYRALLAYIGINSFLSLVFLFYILLFTSTFMNIFLNKHHGIKAGPEIKQI